VGREPLRVEIEDFVACCQTGGTPVSSADVGRDVVAVLEAADRSSVLGGHPMTLGEVLDARSAA
jgi:predicted dehydrogenase